MIPNVVLYLNLKTNIMFPKVNVGLPIFEVQQENSKSCHLHVNFHDHIFCALVYFFWRGISELSWGWGENLTRIAFISLLWGFEPYWLKGSQIWISSPGVRQCSLAIFTATHLRVFSSALFKAQVSRYLHVRSAVREVSGKSTVVTVHLALPFEVLPSRV